MSLSFEMVFVGPDSIQNSLFFNADKQDQGPWATSLAKEFGQWIWRGRSFFSEVIISLLIILHYYLLISRKRLGNSFE